MQWRQYRHRPTSRLFRSVPPPSAREWLRLVENAGLLRVFGQRSTGDIVGNASDVAMRLGSFFRPDVAAELEVLQVVGLLLRDGKLDRATCRHAAQRHGGGVYFDWLLSQVDHAAPDPLPDTAFPLHPGRWKKLKAGTQRRDA